MTSTKPLLALDLFAGAGGFSEGFRQVGFYSVAATDIDPWAGATFEMNHSQHGTKFVLGDIASSEVQEQLFDAVGKRELDCIIGGPPCQGFSQVRNHARLIDDPRNSLYRHYVEVIRRLRPRTFVMENVRGLENLGRGIVRQQILEDLGLEGDYRVESRVVDAACFGVPQNRLRILFVGVRSDLKTEPRFPQSPFADTLPDLDRKPHGDGFSYKHKKSPETVRPAGNLARSPLYPTGNRSAARSGDLAWLAPSKLLLRKPSNAAIDYRGEAENALPAGAPHQLSAALYRRCPLNPGRHRRPPCRHTAGRQFPGSSGGAFGPVPFETANRGRNSAARKSQPPVFLRVPAAASPSFQLDAQRQGGLRLPLQWQARAHRARIRRACILSTTAIILPRGRSA